MKKFFATLLAVAMMLSLAACGGNNSGSGGSTPPASNPSSSTPPASTPSGGGDADAYAALAPVTIEGGDTASEGAAGQLFGLRVSELVSEITGGQLTLDYFPGGTLGGDEDLLRQVQSGDLAIVVCQTAPTVSFIPQMAVFDLPMVFAPYDGATIDKVLNGADSAFKAELNGYYEAAGYHLLGFLQNATYRLTTSNKPLNTLADFRGLNIRTMSNANHMAFWTAIGASPSPIPWADTFFSAQTGAIDAQENAADTCVGANLHTVQDYLACTNHILYANQMAISLKVWQSLDPLYQQALEQAVAQALSEIAPTLKTVDEENKQIMISDGPMTLIEYDNAFFEEVLAQPGVQALYKDINDNQINGLGDTLVAALEAAG